MQDTHLSIAVLEESTQAVVASHRLAREHAVPPGNVAGHLSRVRRQGPPPRRVRYADAVDRVIDHPMRLPSFNETCPHVRDQIIPLNGGRFNVDHYLRVLRAKAVLDVSIAMAMTVRAE